MRQLVLKEFVSVMIDGRKLLAHPYYTEICEKQMKNYRQKCEASARGVVARNKRSER